MYPHDEDPTTSFTALPPAPGSSVPLLKRQLGRRTKIAAAGITGALLVAAGTLIGLALTEHRDGVRDLADYDTRFGVDFGGEGVA